MRKKEIALVSSTGSLPKAKSKRDYSGLLKNLEIDNLFKKN